MLLNGGNFFRRHFDAEVAAGDHDAVGVFEDRFEVLDGLGFFELGDDPGFEAEGGDAEFDVADVFRSADEGDGDGVDAVLHAELEVLLIFFGERGDADRDAGKVDALVLAEHAAVDDLALDVFAGNLEDAQLDEAVGEENARAGLEVFGEGGKGGGDDGGGAEDIARGDGEALAGFELNGDTVLEAAGANLGTLEVAEDADAAAALRGRSCGPSR